MTDMSNPGNIKFTKKLIDEVLADMPNIPKKPDVGRITAKIRSEQSTEGIVKELSAEKMLRMELHLYGFAAAKEISRLRKEPNGEMECPMCGSVLRYSTAASNGHFAARCSRQGCIRAME